MAKRDYYEVLGLQKTASQDEIKKAYRKLAMQFHPDKNQGNKEAEERFKEATEAYGVLSDDKKRQAYDQFGFAGVDNMAGGHDYSNVYNDFSDIFSGFGGFDSIFESFFGGGGMKNRRGSSSRANHVNRGSDLRYNLKIPFKEAIFGTKVEISYSREAACSTCGGSGCESGSKRKTCEHCHGSGQVMRSSGFFQLTSTCPVCNGEGQIIEKPCKSCHGTGVQQRSQKIKVTIPAGIEPGRRIAIPNQGDAGRFGGPSGDLYVYIDVIPHQYFERDEQDLYMMIPISITQAALGAELFIKTLDEKKLKIKIKPGTQNNTLLSIRGEGVPSIQNENHRGNLYIRIRVTIPQKLSAKERSLLSELASTLDETDSPSPIKLSEI